MQPAEALLARLEQFGIRLGLEAFGELLTALGQPQGRFPAVLVAGTNGKGSTSALLAAMASAAGYRTGLYTSPHLELVEERIRIDGQAIAEPPLANLLAQVLEVAQKSRTRPPTYFEALTAAAFLHFAESAVNLAVVEVGMGGRLDATNLAQPVLSLITSVALDHREHLGSTRAAIAREKAGILRRGQLGLFSAESAEAEEAIRRAADSAGATVLAARDLYEVRAVHSRGLAGQRVELATAVGAYELDLALPGAHQVDNLGLAVLAAERLAGLGFPRLDQDAVIRGAHACRWPGRLETVPLADGRTVLLDAAHNPEGMAALGRFLAQQGGSFDLLFAALADKEVEAMLPPLAQQARRVTLTGVASPRALPPQALARLLAASIPATVEADPDAALSGALAERPETLVVCGSLYLVGAIRGRLRQLFGRPPLAHQIFELPAAPASSSSRPRRE